MSVSLKEKADIVLEQQEAGSSTRAGFPKEIPEDCNPGYSAVTAAPKDTLQETQAMPTEHALEGIGLRSKPHHTIRNRRVIEGEIPGDATETAGVPPLKSAEIAGGENSRRQPIHDDSKAERPEENNLRMRL